MIIKPVAEVYASLIMRGLKTEESIPDPIVKEQAKVVVCSRKIYDTREITFAAACGTEPDASDPKYVDNIYTGFCKDEILQAAVVEYCTKKGYGSLVKRIVVA